MRREGDKVAACLFQGDVAIGVAEIRCFRQVKPSDARIVEPRNNFAGVVGAAIADDQKLKILLGLPKYGLNGEAKNIGAVVCRQKHAEARGHTYQPRAPSNL
jgi:hypothetical protein